MEAAFSREQIRQASVVPAIDGEVVSRAPEKRDDFSKFVRMPEGISVVHSSPKLSLPLSHPLYL